MPVTQSDIARRLGINRVTVSRALNGSPLVSDAYRQKILEACQTMGYRPNFHAKGLKEQRTNTISMLRSDDGLNEVHNDWMANLHKAARASGYKLRVDSLDEVRDIIAEGSADGFITFGGGFEKYAGMATFLGGSMVPYVLTDCAESWHYGTLGGCRVTTGNFGGGRMAADRLISLGHSGIVFYGRIRQSGICMERFTGYESALLGAGIQPSPTYVIDRPSWPYDAGQEGECRKQLKRAIREGATAVLAASGIGGLEVLGILRDEGLSVPLDISVIAYDDDVITRFMHPALTVVRQDIPKASEVVLDLLVTIMNGGKAVPLTTIPATLVERESVGPAKR